MDPGARTDRRPDGRADPGRHRRPLALTRRRTRRATALLAALAVTLGARAEDYPWHLPRGFPRPAVPADNPMSEAKVDLGRRLFFETRLSVSGRYSCASCHDPARAFADGRARAVGATGEPLAHNAMALVNVAYNIAFGWDTPQLASLEAQMRLPLFNEHPVELGLSGSEAALCRELCADPLYGPAFARAFPGEPRAVTLEHLIKAIAAFERTLIFGRSPFDRYVFAGEHDALTAQAKRGMALFFSARAGCASCHAGFNFSGNWRDAQGQTGPASYANNGTGGAMRVPTLRNVALSAPYMHDGRFATLSQVIEHYSRGARTSRARDPRLPRQPFSDAQRDALVAFLESLTDATAY